MNFDSHLRNVSSDGSNFPLSLTREDIAALSHYPSLEKMFESNDLAGNNSIKNRLKTTFQNLERAILRGSKDDASRAQIAAKAIRNALNFIELLEQIRTGNKNP